MKRRLVLSMIALAFVSLSINETHGAWGTETYKTVIVLEACSASGGGSLSGSVGPGTASGSVSGDGDVVYAHYAGRLKTCPGWAWGCWDAGATPEITSTTALQGCPNR